jgi:ectoine hydroxylase-related dioxygenase (phytanoyl-CoA dioxygenase family)
VASPWAKCSPSELGLGEPLCLELRAGDVVFMDYRCFHRGGANYSEELRCVMYATFSSEGDHHSYSLESKAQTRRLGEFLSAAEDASIAIEAS